MKKVFSLIVILSTLLLVSCTAQTVPNETTYNYYTSKITPPIASTAAQTDATEGTVYVIEPTEATDPAETAEATTKEPDVPVVDPFAPAGYSIPLIDQEVIETKSKIIMLKYDGDFAVYYSKADGELYPFCFDPFCDHVNFDRKNKTYSTKCVGAMLVDHYASWVNIKHVAYINSRIYFVFFDEIYSCSEFATDLRVEVSFSKKRHFYDWYADPNRGSSYRTPASPIQQFDVDGNNILFKRVDENGVIKFYMYDTVSKKLSSISDKIEAANERLGMTLYVGAVAGGKVFVKGYKDIENVYSEDGSAPLVVGTLVGTYYTDYDFNEFTEIGDVFFYGSLLKTGDGFYNTVEKDGKNSLVFTGYDGTERVLIDDYEKTLGDRAAQLKYMSADGRYFYFIRYNESVVVGRTTSSAFQTEETIKNECGGHLYRYDTKTGKIDTVFDDTSFDIYAVYDYDAQNRTALMWGTKFVFDEKGNMIFDERGNNENYNCLLICELDENGNIISYVEHTQDEE